ncbi:MAG TPA: TPM domain-containing protein [Polyangiaceae bacterium]
MNRLLSDSERAHLAQLVANVESRTAGELVTVVARRSDQYLGFRIGWSAAFGLLSAAVVHLLSPDLPAMELLGAETLCLLLAYGALGNATLLRLVVPRIVRQNSTSQKAQRLFLTLGVTETRDRSGILILLSEFERRVEIIGDRGIHEHLGAEAWKSQVNELVKSIQKGRAAEGLAQVIEHLGRELSARFPPRADDVNELPDHIIVDDS